MKNKIFAGREKELVIGIIFTVAVVIVSATIAMLGMVTPPSKTTDQVANRTKDHAESKNVTEIPAEIQHLIEKCEKRVGRWTIGGEKEIRLFVGEFTPENQQLQGKTIDGWTINVIDLTAEIERLVERPELQICGWTTAGDNLIQLFVYNLTPENQQLFGNKTIIDGWTIFVYESPKPPMGNETGG